MQLLLLLHPLSLVLHHERQHPMVGPGTGDLSCGASSDGSPGLELSARQLTSIPPSIDLSGTGLHRREDGFCADHE
jgi:hypothetical protein